MALRRRSCAADDPLHFASFILVLVHSASVHDIKIELSVQRPECAARFACSSTCMHENRAPHADRISLSCGGYRLVFWKFYERTNAWVCGLNWGFSSSSSRSLSTRYAMSGASSANVRQRRLSRVRRKAGRIALKIKNMFGISPYIGLSLRRNDKAGQDLSLGGLHKMPLAVR